MKISFAKGTETVAMESSMLNRHGMICGATGTGKTVTLKVLSEQFAALGIPVVLADVKGDLANLTKPGTLNPKLEERLKELGLSDFPFSAFPVNLFDLYGTEGIPLRVTISEMGPHLLSQILDLNDTQRGILQIAFRIADDEGLLLIDIKDLRSMLNYLSANKEYYSAMYGNITAQSVSAIQRKILVLEEEGADTFFGEPAIDILDFFRQDPAGRGIINILNCKQLIHSPTIYATFLLYLISELFENLPEIGDTELPKLIFFFDEAHLLFANTPKYLTEKILQTVRLIRSKGVGIFFVTQNPLDIPADIAGQLGNKILHQLRAFTPKEMKAIKEVAATFRENPTFNTEDTIVDLRTGEALISLLDDNGRPSITQKALIYPPHSSFDLLTPDEYLSLVQNSPLSPKYQQLFDRESAYETLQAKVAEPTPKDKKTAKQPKSELQRYKDKGLDSFLGTITRTVGREVARSLLGSIKKNIR